jgi:hypothetical protein
VYAPLTVGHCQTTSFLANRIKSQIASPLDRIFKKLLVGNDLNKSNPTNGLDPKKNTALLEMLECMRIIDDCWVIAIRASQTALQTGAGTRRVCV